MRNNYQTLSHKELKLEILHQKAVIFYSEKAMETLPLIFQAQTERLKKELDLLTERLEEIRTQVKVKKTNNRNRVYN